MAIWQPTQEANALLALLRMLSSSVPTVFTFEQYRNYQFSTSPEKHGKYPGSLTGLKKFCAVCF